MLKPFSSSRRKHWAHRASRLYAKSTGRVPLDFYGIDFDILPDGRLVFFEANAAMNISLSGRKTKGVNEIRAHMRAALDRLFEQTSAKA